MKTVKKILVFAFAVWIFLALPQGYAVILHLQTKVPNNGNLRAVGIALDVSSINWGEIDPGMTKNSQVTIINTGNRPVTAAMEASDWIPALGSSYLTLTWDYAGETILPQQSQQVQFSLRADINIDPSITTFSFNITITGTQI